MKEEFEMEGGNDGGGGLVYGGGGEGQREGEAVLDQDMEGCREDCLLSRKTLGDDEGILDVNGGSERGGRTLAVDLGDSSEGGCADKNGFLHILDVKGREGMKVALDWRKAAVGDCGVQLAVHGEGVGGDNQGVRNEDTMDTEGGGDVHDSPVVEGNDEVRKKSLSTDNMWTVKHCREIRFDEEDVYLVADGVTVNLDKEVASECEIRLGFALIGRILGRSLPFGFLNRELRRRWG